MAIAAGSGVSNNSLGAAVTIDCAKPTGLQEGDLLFFLLSTETGAVTGTIPSGAVLVRNETVLRVYAKVATASEPATYTFANIASANTTLVIACCYFRGQRRAPSEGINAHLVTDATGSLLTTTNVVDYPPLTLTRSGVCVVYFGVAENCASSSISVPSAATQLVYASDGSTNIVVGYLLNQSGVVTPTDGVVSAATESMGYARGVRPYAKQQSIL